MNELPFFTVIVPTYRRPKQIAACLQALSELDYPRDLVEIIIVDDGSPEAPAQAVEAASEKIAVSLVRQPNAGPASARNTGAAQAKGTLLAFTDDDCAPEPDWLLRLAAPFAKFLANPSAEPLLVGGRTINALPQDARASASQTLIDYLYAYYNTQPGGARFFTSNNMAVSAAGYQALGGFDTSFRMAAGEDRDFCDRWAQRGFRLIYAPDACIRHFHAMSPRAFWKQHFRYGQAAFRYHQSRVQTPLQVEPLSFYSGLLRAPFHADLLPDGAPQDRGKALKTSALLCMSQVANAAGYAAEKAKRR